MRCRGWFRPAENSTPTARLFSKITRAACAFEIIRKFGRAPMIGRRYAADARVEAIEIYVSRLRKKLEGADVVINTLRGLGYLLAERPAP